MIETKYYLKAIKNIVIGIYLSSIFTLSASILIIIFKEFIYILIIALAAASLIFLSIDDYARAIKKKEENIK